jgi:hypothetical protein
MNHKVFGLAASLAVLVLAACASSSTATNNNTPPASTSQGAQASSSPSASASAATTTLNPCQVVTQSEASQLASTSYAAGTLDTTQSGSQICWYGAQTRNVFEVLVAQASSASAAQSGWDQEKTKVLSSLNKATNVPGVSLTVNISDTSIAGADRAAAGTMSFSIGGHALAGSGVYLLKGATFVAIVNLVLDHAAPTVAAMEAEAQTALGRVP